MSFTERSEMSPKQSAGKGVSLQITVSEALFEELALVCEERGIPVATKIRAWVENEGDSPSWGALVRRTRTGMGLSKAIEILEDNPEGLNAEQAAQVLKLLRKIAGKDE